jgi:hypothetical protein
MINGSRIVAGALALVERSLAFFCPLLLPDIARLKSELIEKSG